MEPAALEFFQRILETPSPSGYESPIQQIVRDYVGDFADEVTTDVHGNVIAVRNPDAPLRLMLAGRRDVIEAWHEKGGVKTIEVTFAVSRTAGVRSAGRFRAPPGWWCL